LNRELLDPQVLLDSEAYMTSWTYSVLLLSHVLFFVYWLGADLAVLYAAKFGADQNLSVESRRAIGDIMAFVDLFPRLSVPLIGATGVTMSFLSGEFIFHKAWIWFVWLAALLWVSSNLFVYLNRTNSDRIRSVLRFDTLWRVILLVATGGVAATSLLGAGITSNHSLAAKLLIFALAIALSLVLRVLFKPYRPALGRIVKSGDNPTDSAIMTKALASAKPIVLSIWSLTVIAAAIGLWKPF
jgi:hypothetical protein